MKKLCLFIFAIGIAFSVYAQGEKGYVYLKNGTILKGKYSYSTDLKKLKLYSAGNTWIFDAVEIDSISSLKSFRLSQSESFSANSPFFYRFEIGVLAGNSENSQVAPLSFTGSVNYSINSNVSVGAGLGVEFLKESCLPAFFNLEYKVRDTYSTPYFFLKGGYQIPLEDSRTVYYNIYPAWSSVWPGPDYSHENLDAKGGVLINPGIGYHRMFSSGFGMSVAFGYQFHRLQYKGENDYKLEIDYNRLTIKIGITFN